MTLYYLDKQNVMVIDDNPRLSLEQVQVIAKQARSSLGVKGFIVAPGGFVQVGDTGNLQNFNSDDFNTVEKDGVLKSSGKYTFKQLYLYLKIAGGFSDQKATNSPEIGGDQEFGEWAQRAGYYVLEYTRDDKFVGDEPTPFGAYAISVYEKRFGLDDWINSSHGGEEID